MLKVFMSYSHADEDMRNELEKHLAMLKRDGRIETWNDRRMLPGSEIDPTIKEVLETADIILLLISSDFLASYYCYEMEMKRALERHEAREARVVPVILRTCDWMSSPIGILLAVPTDGKPVKTWPHYDEPFTIIAQQLRQLVDDISAKKLLKAKPKHEPKGSQLFERILTAPTPQGQREIPRSSNLRIRQKFTDHQRDEFLKEAFRFMGNFVEGSLNELKNRNRGLDISFARISANAFTAVIYRDGKAVSRCGISLVHRHGSHGEIQYSSTGTTEVSYNEALTVGEDDQILFLKASMFGYGRDERKLTHEGAAELYWEMLIEPLRR